MEFLRWESFRGTFGAEKMQNGPTILSGTIINSQPENVVGDITFAQTSNIGAADARLPVVTRLGQSEDETQHGTVEIVNGCFSISVIRKELTPFLIHLSGLHFFNASELAKGDSTVEIVLLQPSETPVTRQLIAKKVGDIVFLTGEIPEVTFHGFIKMPLALLPKEFCPPRAIQTVCAFQCDICAPVTILPSGYIEVGPVATDGRKKRIGNVSFDGICFPLVDGADITPPASIMFDMFDCDPTLYAFRYDCVVMLSGRITQQTVLPRRYCPRTTEHFLVTCRFGGLADVLTIGTDGHVRTLYGHQGEADEPFPISLVYLSTGQLDKDDIVERAVFAADLSSEVKSALNPDIELDWMSPNNMQCLDLKRRDQQWQIDRAKTKMKFRDRKTFENIRYFMLRHDTLGLQITHCNLNGAFDIFTNTGKWFFPSDSGTRDSLYSIIEWCWHRDITLFMTEKQGSIFPFIEDVDIHAYSDWNGPNSAPPDIFIMQPPWISTDPGWFIRERAETLFSIFVEWDELTCYVYTASGTNKSKGIQKSSFHLIWPDIYVHTASASKVRLQTLLDIGKKLLEPNSCWRRLEDVLLQLHPTNTFDLIFDKTAATCKSGLRLPFCDKAVMTPDPAVDDIVKAGLMTKKDQRPIRIPENRANYPIGELKVHYDRKAQRVTDAWWVRTPSEVPIVEWVRRGACGVSEGKPPTLTRTQFREFSSEWR